MQCQKSLTLNFLIWQWVCYLPFSLSRWPIHSLWKDVTMQPFDCQKCKTRNRWHSVDVHINHIETAFLHWIIVCNQSYRHYWHLILHLYVLSFASRSFVTSQFLINCFPHYLSERWCGPITFRRFRPAICGMYIISLVFGKYSSTFSPFLVQLLLLDFQDIP